MLAGTVSANHSHLYMSQATYEIDISTLPVISPLDNYIKTLAQFPAVFVATKIGILSQTQSFPDQVVFVPKPNESMSTVL